MVLIIVVFDLVDLYDLRIKWPFRFQWVTHVRYVENRQQLLSSNNFHSDILGQVDKKLLYIRFYYLSWWSDHELEWVQIDVDRDSSICHLDHC